jgi:hypothetical protein
LATTRPHSSDDTFLTALSLFKKDDERTRNTFADLQAEREICEPRSNVKRFFTFTALADELTVGEFIFKARKYLATIFFAASR